MNQVIRIYGAAGWIGSNLSRMFNEAGYVVIGFDRRDGEFVNHVAELPPQADLIAKTFGDGVNFLHCANSADCFLTDKEQFAYDARVALAFMDALPAVSRTIITGSHSVVDMPLSPYSAGKMIIEYYADLKRTTERRILVPRMGWLPRQDGEVTEYRWIDAVRTDFDTIFSQFRKFYEQ